MSGKTLRWLWHLLGGAFFPVLAFFIPRGALLVAVGSVTGAFLAAEAARLAVPRLNRWALSHLPPLFRERERTGPTGSSYLLVATLVAFIALPREVAVAALLFLAVGDPAAAAVGERFPLCRLGGKSLGGAAAFFLTSTAAGAVLAWGGAGPALWLVAIGAAVAALVELLPLPLNDNLLIPLLSGPAMALLGPY